jgi:antitoxin YefM
VLDSVVDDREEVVITRARHTPVVMVALDDYEALQETVHLLRSPANAHRLLDAMGRLDAASDHRQTNFLLATRDATVEVDGLKSSARREPVRLGHRASPDPHSCALRISWFLYQAPL